MKFKKSKKLFIKDVAIYATKKNIDGFTVQKGFLSFEVDGEKYFTSKWTFYNDIITYYKKSNEYKQKYFNVYHDKKLPRFIIAYVTLMHDKFYTEKCMLKNVKLILTDNRNVYYDFIV
jgi:hypothetical protein